jgi:hypothetical protein
MGATGAGATVWAYEGIAIGRVIAARATTASADRMGS